MDQRTDGSLSSRRLSLRLGFAGSFPLCLHIKLQKDCALGGGRVLQDESQHSSQLRVDYCSPGRLGRLLGRCLGLRGREEGCQRGPAGRGRGAAVLEEQGPKGESHLFGPEGSLCALVPA